MKAIQVVGPGKMEIIEKEMPRIARDDEVLIKVRLAGICGSDMHIYHGTSPMAIYPRVIGHEMAGEVAGIGPAVKWVKPGDRVVMEPIEWCGECYACKSGRKNVCVRLQVYGAHKDGAFCEYIVLPERIVHKVEERLDWHEAVLIEPFTIGAQANWRGRVETGDIVFIMGAGTIGLCSLQVAKIKGAICIVSDLSDDKLAYAKSIGADYVLNPLKSNVPMELERITGALGPNVTIDAVCTAKTFEQAVEVTSVAGRVVCLGFDASPSSIAQFSITKKELTIAGSRLQSDKFVEVIGWFHAGVIRVNSFVTHRFGLKEIHQAIELIETRPDKVRKVVLEMG